MIGCIITYTVLRVPFVFFLDHLAFSYWEGWKFGSISNSIVQDIAIIWDNLRFLYVLECE
jgi:hypothetical protein